MSFLDCSLVLVDGYVDTRIMRASHSNNPTISEASKKRSLPNIFDLPSKLDFTTLQSIAHQTGSVLLSISFHCNIHSFQHDLRQES